MTRVAVVVAGGEGRRMGGGKPTRAYGDTTLVAQAVAQARAYADTVAVAIRQVGQAGDELDARLILDDLTLVGPLAGLASALAFGQHNGASHVLSLPCDAPRLPRDLWTRLEAALTGQGLAQVAVAASGGRIHPVCALWPTSALADLRRYSAASRSSLKGFASELGMTIVEWEAGSEDPFANANTPEDLAALQPTR